MSRRQTRWGHAAATGRAILAHVAALVLPAELPQQMVWVQALGVVAEVRRVRPVVLGLAASLDQNQVRTCVDYSCRATSAGFELFSGMLCGATKDDRILSATSTGRLCPDRVLVALTTDIVAEIAQLCSRQLENIVLLFECMLIWNDLFQISNASAQFSNDVVGRCHLCCSSNIVRLRETLKAYMYQNHPEKRDVMRLWDELDNNCRTGHNHVGCSNRQPAAMALSYAPLACCQAGKHGRKGCIVHRLDDNGSLLFSPQRGREARLKI